MNGNICDATPSPEFEDRTGTWGCGKFTEGAGACELTWTGSVEGIEFVGVLSCDAEPEALAGASDWPADCWYRRNA